MQKAQNSTAELLAGRKAAVPAGERKKNKLGLQPALACPYETTVTACLLPRAHLSH